MGKIIGVVSLKGGVGKTSVVVALGAALAKFGRKVLLIDGNLSAPNLGMHLNIIEPDITLNDVLANKQNINDAIYVREDFDIIPASLFSRETINPLKLKEKIRYLKNRYDTILIDSSPALNEETLAVMLASDELLVVATPDYATLGTTLKAIKTAKQRGENIIGLILNKVYNKNFEIAIDDIENTIDIPIMAVVPHDTNVLKAQSKFTPFTNYQNKGEASNEYKKLAAALLGEQYKDIKLKKFFKWINPRRQDINRTIFYKSRFAD